MAFAKRAQLLSANVTASNGAGRKTPIESSACRRFLSEATSGHAISPDATSGYAEIVPEPATPPPPKAGWRDRVLGIRRRIANLSNPVHWLLTWGIWIFVALFMIYVLDGLLIGWAAAYEILVGITSPAHAPYPLVSWVTSLAGWLIIPAIIGGAAGYLVDRQIDARRSRDKADLEAELRALAGLQKITPPEDGS
jgi:hypothetical protein